MTDNGAAYISHAHALACRQLGIRHLRTRPYTPRTNGKAERPVGVTVFPDELYPAPRSWAEKAYPKLIHFNEVDEGGHFAAWEQPEILSEELRATFRSLRLGKELK
jgi:transposase InsO family protein